MTETLNWDHTMIAVTDLDAAVKYFNDHGFGFTPGGNHQYWGTKNALDYFGINYLELLTVADKKQAAAFPYENNSGIYEAVQDYFNGIQRFTTIAIRSSDIKATHRRLAAAGVDVGEITSGKRVDPHGNLIQWQIFYVNDKLPNNLPFPFFIQWGEADQQREQTLKEKGLIKPHPAGDLYVKQAIFHVTDPQQAAAALGKALMITPVHEESGEVITISDRQLIFKPGPENRLVKLVFNGATTATTLALGQINFALTTNK